jgi:hypothetical protein
LIPTTQFKKTYFVTRSAFIDGEVDARQAGISVSINALPLHMQSAGTPRPQGEKMRDLIVAFQFVHSASSLFGFLFLQNFALSDSLANQRGDIVGSFLSGFQSIRSDLPLLA